MTPKTISELQWCAAHAKRILDNRTERTKRLQRISFLARSGQKDTQEFKELERAERDPHIVDIGGLIERLARLDGKIK